MISYTELDEEWGQVNAGGAAVRNALVNVKDLLPLTTPDPRADSQGAVCQRDAA
jgi:hypothetical protein